MWMMFRVVPIMWRAVRPSKVVDMPAVVNSFWMRKGFEGLTFFGQILTPNQSEANNFNRVVVGDLQSPTRLSADLQSAQMKNHEMIHLRQAQSCGDSWLRFYLLYIWYWLRALPANRKMKHGAYLLNPFEMEAYRHMNNLNYLANHEATEWRQFAKMKLRDRFAIYRGNVPITSL